MMGILSWVVRLALLLLMMGFAFQNAEPVTLHYFGFTWNAPMVLIIMAFFVGGVAAGLLAISTTLYKQRREITALKRLAKKHATKESSADRPSSPSGMTDKFPPP